MQSTVETYLALLRKALGIETVHDAQCTMHDGDMGELMRLCQIHGTGPLVYDQLLKKTLPPTPSLIGQGREMQMKQVCMQNMLLQDQWERVIAKAFTALEEGGVHAVLLKGFGLAALYPKPYLRSWGDADIWVGIEQYHKACGILREAFPEAIHHDEEWEDLKHYCFVFPDGKAIELHRVAMDFASKSDARYWQELEREGLKTLSNSPSKGENSVLCGGRKIPLPEAKFNLLFTFMHAWEHFCSSGMPLKQICDLFLLAMVGDDGRRWAMMGEDREELEEYLRTALKKLKMMEAWQLVGYLMKRVMGDDPDGSGQVGRRLARRGERFVERVLSEGQCRAKEYQDGAKDRYEAREKAKRMNVIARKWLTLSSRFDSYRFLRQYTPRYARHILWAEILKGLRRTITGAKMIDY